MNFSSLRTAFSLAVAASLLPLHAASDSASAQAVTVADYVLQPQDEIRVWVFEEEEINKQCDGISISAECTVTLPLIRTISLKGKTVRQAEEMIRALYDKDFIINPQVTVTVLKYAERTVNVVGSVTKQGQIPFPKERGLTIVDAIALAGGQTRLANLKEVKLTRNGENRIINVDAMVKSGGRDAVMLEPGDTILVPERIF